MVIEVVAELGGSIEQEIVARWLCQVGDRVRRGETLGEVETDKADVVLETPADGVVEAIHVAERATFARGAALLRLRPSDIGTGPSDLAQRAHAPKPIHATNEATAERRCRFCQALQLSNRHDCARCGAPL